MIIDQIDWLETDHSIKQTRYSNTVVHGLVSINLLFCLCFHCPLKHLHILFCTWSFFITKKVDRDIKQKLTFLCWWYSVRVVFKGFFQLKVKMNEYKVDFEVVHSCECYNAHLTSSRQFGCSRGYVPNDSNLFPADNQHRVLGEQSVYCGFVAGVQVGANHLGV